MNFSGGDGLDIRLGTDLLGHEGLDVGDGRVGISRR